MQLLLQWKSNKYYIFWVWACSFSYPAWNAHAPYFNVACSAVQYFCTLSHKRQNFQKKIARKICFDFLHNICLKRFSFYELSEICSKLHIDFHVNYLFYLSDFNKNLIFSAHFRKTVKHKMSWKSVQCESSCSMRAGGRADRRTDGPTYRHDEVNSLLFAVFSKALKNASAYN